MSEDCGCGSGGIGGAGRVLAEGNPAGLSQLAWRVSPHDAALARMRQALGGYTSTGTEAGTGAGATAPSEEAERARVTAIRGLAHQPTEDPATALLDAWAVVADLVSFYTERVAQEGFLRTATERLSVRELARMLGYELRPGVAAQVELAFSAETAPGSPETLVVAKGTPVQSVPGQDELPQTFETSDELEVRGVWNALPGRASVPQRYDRDSRTVWLAAASTTVQPGDHVLVVGSERARLARRRGLTEQERRAAKETWDFRRVQAVTVAPDGRQGWIRLDLDRKLGNTDSRPLIAEQDLAVHTFTDKTRLFGHNAPDPTLLVTTEGAPPGAVVKRRGGERTEYRWEKFNVFTRELELDGDHATIRPGTWIVLEQPSYVEALLVTQVEATGLAKWALTGPVTLTTIDLPGDLDRFGRRQAKVHCGSVPLPAADAPRDAPVEGAVIQVAAADPPLPAGRLVLVTGVAADTGETVAESATVVACTSGPHWMTLTLQSTLQHSYRPETLVVRGNVVAATHGETVQQVLGSGTNRPFGVFAPRRAPLTYVRAAVPEGSVAALEVRVDDVAWREIRGLDQAGPSERAYVLRHTEDGGARIEFGDGVHGARVPTGIENVRASYRVGIGQPGGVRAGQLSLLPRRPLGVREVVNPAAAHDWAPPETLEEARTNAPLRVRTLDRAVSAADHADFARAFAGVGPARADLVWNGRASVVLVSLLGVAGAEPSDGLIADVTLALLAARDPGHVVAVLPAEVLEFALSVAIAHDPAHLRDLVLADVRAALTVAYGRPGRTITAPVTDAEVLATIRSVPGVRACTLPEIGPIGARRSARTDRLLAEPGRFDPAQGLLAAQLWALSATGVTIREMIL